MNDDADKYKAYISELFDSLKRKNLFDEYRSLPLLDKDAKIVGFLRPLTFDYEIIYPEAVSLISKWRRENPTLSNSVFEVTDQRTKKWIDELILRRKDRILFFIDDLQGHHVGHIAYSSFDFQNKTAEIDAVLRGERASVHGIMTMAMKSMLYWAEKNLSLNSIQLRVNENNDKAIALYTRCGFEKISRLPLFRRELENEIRWDEDPSRDISEAERFELLMQYKKESLS